jgi:cation diffusion facilitator family transporter
MEYAGRKARAALLSIAASVLLALGKFVAALLSGSLALYSEAAHGLIDIAATTLTWFAVRAADRPADEQHHYGHGKIESLAALLETGLLFALAFYVIHEAVLRLFGEAHAIEAVPLAFWILGLSLLIDAWRWQALSKVAKETHSEALAADALHFSSDLVSSALTILGLIGVASGMPRADALAALGGAIFIAIAGFRLLQRTLATLLDAAPSGVTGELRALATNLPGIVAVEEIKVRSLGGRLAAEMQLAVPRTLPQERVQNIIQRLSALAKSRHPRLNLSLRTVPQALSDETILERVLLVAMHKRIPVHRVIVQTIAERLCLSLDIEVDGTLSLNEAHARAGRIEAALREEFGPQTEVETHIEPLALAHLEAEEAPEDQRLAMEQALVTEASRTDHAKQVHSVRVRCNAQGLIVNYHCRFDPTLSVAEVHAEVDGIERAVRAHFPAILRLIGHAEPLRR